MEHLDQQLSSSIAICTKDRPSLLMETILSIFEGVRLPDELIVVDQSTEPNSELQSLQSMQECPIHYIWTDTRGASKARNIALMQANCDVVILTDDDMLFASDWLHSMVRALRQFGERSVVTGQVRPYEKESHLGHATCLIMDEAPARYTGIILQEVLFSGNMGLYRSVFHEIGGFDEELGPGCKFPAGEDNDYGFRLLKTGYNIHYRPEVVSYHRSWRTAIEYVLQHWHYGIGRGAFIMKHLHNGERTMWTRLRYTLGHHLSGAFQRLAHLAPHVSVCHLLFCMGLFVGAGQWIWQKQFARGKR